MTTQTQDKPISVQTAEMTWSATRLKSYLTCPRQFRYSYMDAIPSIPTSPLVFGRALHDALCFVHERQMESGELPPVRDVLERFDALWGEALEAEPFFRDGVPSPSQHLTTGHEILRAYLAAPENQKLPLAAELAFEVQAGDYRLAGIVDRLDESEQGLIVVDFKSGTRKPSPKDLDEDLQFTIYAFAIEQMMGRPVEKVVHCHLRTGDCFNTHRTSDHFAWLLDEVLPFVAGGVARGEFAPRSGYWCNWCDYRELCRAENARDAEKVEFTEAI